MNSTTVAVPPLMVTISGIRGIAVPQEKFNNEISLTNEVIDKYVSAYCSLLKRHSNEASIVSSNVFNSNNSKTIIVGRDSRVTGAEILDRISEVITKCGYDVLSVGIVPTPTVQQLVKIYKAAGGIVVTASHNPFEWNGIKFVGPRSIFLTPDECREMFDDSIKNYDIYKKSIADGIAKSDSSLAKKNTISSLSAVKQHIDYILSKCSRCFDIEKIRAAKLNVCFDSICGAGGEALTELFNILNVNVVSPINVEQNGMFPRAPEPIPENLESLHKHVSKIRSSRNIDIVFAVDPDADRCVTLDETGSPIGEELTLAISIDYMLNFVILNMLENMRQNAKSHSNRRYIHLVKNLSTSMHMENIAEKFMAEHKDLLDEVNVEIVLHRTAVGEVNLAVLMEELEEENKKKNNIILVCGGEGNGGCMLPLAHSGRDSLVAVCCVLSWYIWRKSIKSNADMKFSELVNKIFPKTSMIKTKFDISLMSRETIIEKLTAMLIKLQEEDEGKDDLIVSKEDGIWIFRKQEKSWVHVRFSNTEPIMRIIGESFNEKTTLKRINEVSSIVRDEKL